MLNRNVRERRICWPKFDALCLEGGCIHCNDKPFRGIVAIMHEANKKDLFTVFRHGHDNYWYDRIDYR